jgi:hypothetical protein
MFGTKVTSENIASVSLVMGFKVVFGGVRPAADVALVGATVNVRLDVVNQSAFCTNIFGTQSTGEISFTSQIMR